MAGPLLEQKKERPDSTRAIDSSIFEILAFS
jgi:hypothetical protein